MPSPTASDDRASLATPRASGSRRTAEGHVAETLMALRSSAHREASVGSSRTIAVRDQFAAIFFSVAFAIRNSPSSARTIAGRAAFVRFTKASR
jgi:hypothetical protein